MARRRNVSTEKMKNQEGIKLGIAWYREDQWQLLKSIASGPDIIEETYQEWLQCAEESLRKLKHRGLKPVKVDFDVKEFMDWCAREGRKPDGESRSEYTAELLRKGQGIG
jgi:hypothetical protein